MSSLDKSNKKQKSDFEVCKCCDCIFVMPGCASADWSRRLPRPAPFSPFLLSLQIMADTSWINKDWRKYFKSSQIFTKDLLSLNSYKQYLSIIAIWESKECIIFSIVINFLVKPPFGYIDLRKHFIYWSQKANLTWLWLSLSCKWGLA